MADEQFNENIAVEDAITKYGGGDAAYEQKLKEHVRNFLGYSNRVSQMNQMPSINDPAIKARMGGGVEGSFMRETMTPGGVSAAVGAGIGQRNIEMGKIQQLARASASQSKKAKAEAEAEAFRNLSNFDDRDSLDKAISRWAGNPLSEEGGFKSLDELKQELQGAVAGGDAQWTEEDVEARLSERIPETLREDLQETYYKSLGYTDVKAQNLVRYDRYAKGEMSEAETELYRITDPTFAAKAEAAKEMPGLQSEMDKIQTDSGDALTFTDLQKKFPDVTPEQVKPYYETSALDDINQMIDANVENMPAVEVTDQGIAEAVPLDVFLESTSSIGKTLGVVYNGVLTKSEIDYLLYQAYNSRVQKLNESNQ